MCFGWFEGTLFLLLCGVLGFIILGWLARVAAKNVRRAVVCAAVLCPACSSAGSVWDEIHLDAGLAVQLPLLGVTVDPHVRLDLGKDRMQHEVAPTLSGDELLVLARLRVAADG